MMKRIFIIHGWSGHPDEGWKPWLKEELKKIGFEVHIPQLPQSDKPRINKWIPAIAKAVKKADSQTYFVGHSMGCQAIARYLETLPKNIKVGGAVFVAGFFKRLTGLEDDHEVQETSRHWLKTPIDFQKVRLHLPKSIAIFSDDDPWVPLDNQNDFKEKLGSKIILEHKMGHFSASEFFERKIRELPIVLTSVLEIANEN